MANKEIAHYELFLLLFHNVFKSRLLKMRQSASANGKKLMALSFLLLQNKKTLLYQEHLLNLLQTILVSSKL